jgi:hypothetical protein
MTEKDKLMVDKYSMKSSKKFLRLLIFMWNVEKQFGFLYSIEPSIACSI